MCGLYIRRERQKHRNIGHLKSEHYRLANDIMYLMAATYHCNCVQNIIFSYYYYYCY